MRYFSLIIDQNNQKMQGNQKHKRRRKRSKTEAYRKTSKIGRAKFNYSLLNR